MPNWKCTLTFKCIGDGHYARLAFSDLCRLMLKEEPAKIIVARDDWKKLPLTMTTTIAYRVVIRFLLAETTKTAPHTFRAFCEKYLRKGDWSFDHARQPGPSPLDTWIEQHSGASAQLEGIQMEEILIFCNDKLYALRLCLCHSGLIQVKDGVITRHDLRTIRLPGHDADPDDLDEICQPVSFHIPPANSALHCAIPFMDQPTAS